jgi:hypothetical protein
MDALAAEILDRLQRSPAAGEIVLGGYFALREYLDYRSTRDLDAWWRTGRSERAVQIIEDAVKAVGEHHGLASRVREWGETVSFELVADGKVVFSFQVALRSVELEPPLESRWPPILIESLRDNIASKMNALVQRGAARDFLDVREAVLRGLLTVAACWDLWTQKNPQGNVTAARAHVLKHLEALELRRPLGEIANPEERAAAGRARGWIRETLLGMPRPADS